ncbi:hypothetical protein ACI5ML_004904 [Salmonella enterica subsp. enterica serovar Give]
MKFSKKSIEQLVAGKFSQDFIEITLTQQDNTNTEVFTGSGFLYYKNYKLHIKINESSSIRTLMKNAREVLVRAKRIRISCTFCRYSSRGLTLYHQRIAGQMVILLLRALVYTDAMEFSLGRKLTSAECQSIFRCIEDSINKAIKGMEGVE